VFKRNKQNGITDFGFQTGPEILIAGLIACILLLMAGGCQESPANQPEAIIATVGNLSISVEEFRINYELGFPNLKTGKHPRQTYLNFLIDEKLLALEAYRLGMHKRPEMVEKIENLRKELLIGEVFNEFVDESIVISDEEIEEVRLKDHVYFRLRFLPVSEMLEAERLSKVLIRNGFDQAFSEWKAGLSEQRYRASDFDSGLISWSDIDPELMDVISGLSIGSVSQPIPYHGNFLLVQVTDIQRTPLTNISNETEKQRYQKVLLHKKAKIRSREFIKELMSSSELRIKAGAYKELERVLWTWLQSQGEIVNLYDALELSEDPSADTIHSMYDRVLLTTQSDQWTISRFVKEYPYSRYPFSTVSFDEFRSDLYDGFGLLLRDQKFLELAESKGYGDLPTLNREVELWSDKWVYRELLSEIRDTVSVLPSDMTAYFLEHRSYWASEVRQDEVSSELEEKVRHAKTRASVNAYVLGLRKRIEISVDTEMLSRLHLTDVSKPSSSMITIVKGWSGQPAWPVVDPGR